MKELRRVDMPSSNRSWVRWNSRELDLRAKVVVAAGALEAVVARYTRFHCYVVASFEVLDFCACPDDCTCTFVAETVVALDDERANSACVPEVDVGAGGQLVTC